MTMSAADKLKVIDDFRRAPGDNRGILIAVSLGADSKLIGALLHLFDEFIPRPDCIFLYGVLIHINALA